MSFLCVLALSLLIALVAVPSDVQAISLKPASQAQQSQKSLNLVNSNSKDTQSATTNVKQAPAGGHAGARPTHIVFLGCSVSRYLYLDLAEYVKYNGAAQDWIYESNPRYLGWADFYSKTQAYLGDKCDCFRSNDPNASFGDKNSLFGRLMENRWFAFGNTFVSYYQWFGDALYPNGHWKPNSAIGVSYPQSLPCQAGDTVCGQTTPNWNYQVDKNVSAFLDVNLFELEPRPTHVVVENVVHFPIPLEVLQKFLKRAKHYMDGGANPNTGKGSGEGVEFVWLTKSQGESVPEVRAANAKAAEKAGFKVFDISAATGPASPIAASPDVVASGGMFYEGNIHYKEQVNRKINREILERAGAGAVMGGGGSA